jgi:hypothetical protein
MAVFWVAAPCRLVKVYQRFRVPYRLHHQGDEQDAGVESVSHTFPGLVKVLPWLTGSCISKQIPRTRLTHSSVDGGGKEP